MSPFFKTTIYYRLPVIALCTAIFWQSSYPSAISTSLFSFQDKVLHFIVYAILSLLSARALKKDKPHWPVRRIILAAIIFTSLYGLSDEIHQAFVPSRSASLPDLTADIAGSIAGAFCIKTS